ncbi:MAG: hydantoinase B/oxoprolinase family protein [Betaproteobacteria bacterium AqS2]|uniref:Hydantoinase B/oxoprolinase family protein n=1 Tax=Candidatus Amphirhobacter heronislandensis TaxID=1732024 RepID=A0A930Y2M9_9GAMM|nr:hydantoinase B/oxoprolinase family protein [Betaproteobacteria bacterium AqS2]
MPSTIRAARSAAGAAWRFWIDRGGTFTDVIGVDGAGRLRVAKVPSHDPDAALRGVRELLGIAPRAPLPRARVAAVRMGTTVATNALLERKGCRLGLLVTKGFGDILRIRDQSRPELFDLFPQRPAPLYRLALEVPGRLDVRGRTLEELDERAAAAAARRLAAAGCEAVAIVGMHGHAHPAHEKRLARICRAQGLREVFMSHAVEATQGLVARGETTVVDAYLTPLLQRHVQALARRLPGVDLRFMQSNGGLAAARGFTGSRAILSGPAGGVVGAIAAARRHGVKKLVSLDMGGTSTDVAHCRGELERAAGATVAGMAVATPMLKVNTVAAGGGSICGYANGRIRVGPESAGADPGPACYGRGGPLTVTDCNLVLGRLEPASFPAVFGPAGDRGLDPAASRKKLAELARRAGYPAAKLEQLAEDCVDVAVENMAKAVKAVSVQQGHDLAKDYALVAFGGAGGQHACQLAERLGIGRVLLHPLAGVLSAAGIGLAALRELRRRSVGCDLAGGVRLLRTRLAALEAPAVKKLRAAGVKAKELRVARRVLLRYPGSSATIAVSFGTLAAMRREFAAAHRRLYGLERPAPRLIAAAVEVEASGPAGSLAGLRRPRAAPRPLPARIRMRCGGQASKAPVHQAATLKSGARVTGPCLVLEETSTTCVPPGWKGEVAADGSLLLRRAAVRRPPARRGAGKPNPARLEMFHSIFMSIAEQMGHVLRNTAYSVNIKERLDFSCAVFDARGDLIANAPHIPVHLGSMGATVKAAIAANPRMRPGDAWLVNAPAAGGTHLPDLTVVTPLFLPRERRPRFFLCSRGHHTDIGGRSPGSMPADATRLAEEGVVFDCFPIVRGGRFAEAAFRTALAAHQWPARDPDQNIADLLAQLAANAKGAAELRRACTEQGLAEVIAYMGHIKANAKQAVLDLLPRLRAGVRTVAADGGGQVRAALRPGRGRLLLDFAGTSAQDPGNLNAPPAVTEAAAHYVLRCLVTEDIPLNAGCMEAVTIKTPAGSLLRPGPAAAVAAGNVEISQLLASALLGAAGAAAESQGTMNNLSFGNARFQYYETICGGAGAGPGKPGADAVHTHMTNTLITDPEVLEERCPVILEEFAIRRGSGGKGAARGGCGVIRRLRFLEPVEISMLANKRRVAPYGMRGGGPGRRGQDVLLRTGRRVPPLAPGRWRAEAGDVFEVRTPGGGGWGKA